MTARMIVDRRRYTKAQKDAYRARAAKRRRPRVWLNGQDITDLLAEFKLDAWQSYFITEALKTYDVVVGRDGSVLSRHHFADQMGRRVPTIDPRGGVL